MRRNLWLLLLLAAAVQADEYNAGGTIVQGDNIRTASGLIGDNDYAIQCPNIDGGSGQKVFYRPGGCTGCVTDAGLGDVLMDFTSATGSPDPYFVRLRVGMDRLHLRSYTAADPLWCTVIPKSRSR